MLLSELVQLDEANVYNIKQPVTFSPSAGMEITVEALNTYLLDHIGGEWSMGGVSISDALVKKLTKYLVSAEKYHTPLDGKVGIKDVPEWAKNANDLAVILTKFTMDGGAPMDTLKDKVHLMVDLKTYIDRFKRELVRRKAELSQKSAKNLVHSIMNYPTGTHDQLGHLFVFDAGDELLAQAEEDTHGPENLRKDGYDIFMDAGEYIWEKISSERAARRAGKVLDNCLGQLITYFKLESEHQVVYALREKSTGSLKMAVRMDKGDDTEIYEARVSNNRVPVDQKHIAALVKLATKLDPHTADYHTYDLLRNAGYKGEMEQGDKPSHHFD